MGEFGEVYTFDFEIEAVFYSIFLNFWSREKNLLLQISDRVH